MKFGIALGEHSEEYSGMIDQSRYLDYEKLKEALYSEPDTFLSLFQSEVQKLEHFLRNKDSQFEPCTVEGCPCHIPGKEARIEFLKMNREGARKILKKYDKQTTSHMQAEYLHQVDELFNTYLDDYELFVTRTPNFRNPDWAPSEDEPTPAEQDETAAATADSAQPVAPPPAGAVVAPVAVAPQQQQQQQLLLPPPPPPQLQPQLQQLQPQLQQLQQQPPPSQQPQQIPPQLVLYQLAMPQVMPAASLATSPAAAASAAAAAAGTAPALAIDATAAGAAAAPAGAAAAVPAAAPAVAVAAASAAAKAGGPSMVPGGGNRFGKKLPQPAANAATTGGGGSGGSAAGPSAAPPAESTAVQQTEASAPPSGGGKGDQEYVIWTSVCGLHVGFCHRLVKAETIGGISRISVAGKLIHTTDAFLVYDPQNKGRYLVPPILIEDTIGKNDYASKAKSFVCMLHQKGGQNTQHRGCNAYQSCNQLHVSRPAITALREMAASGAGYAVNTSTNFVVELKGVYDAERKTSYVLPYHRTEPTAGRAHYSKTKDQPKARAPQLCLFYLEGRCRHGKGCRAIHGDPPFIAKLRHGNPCCPRHHKGRAVEPPSNIGVKIRWGSTQEGLTVDMPHDLVTATTGLLSLPLKAWKGGQYRCFAAGKVCRLHRENRCEYGDSCNNIHVCQLFDLEARGGEAAAAGSGATGSSAAGSATASRCGDDAARELLPEAAAVASPPLPSQQQQQQQAAVTPTTVEATTATATAMAAAAAASVPSMTWGPAGMQFHHPGLQQMPAQHLMAYGGFGQPGAMQHIPHPAAAFLRGISTGEQGEFPPIMVMRAVQPCPF